MPYVYPDNDLSYTGNFLNMLFRTSETRTAPIRLSSARSTFCSFCTPTTSRTARPTPFAESAVQHVDPYCASAAAIAALYGPLHGGANEEVLRMLMEIGSIAESSGIHQARQGGRDSKLMGFGHRIYKNYDPRARIIKNIAYEVFELMGKNPLLEIALECERIALEDEYFVKRKLYPERGLLYRPDLPVHGLSNDDVPRAFRDSAHVGLGGAMGRDASGSGAKDCAAAANLSWPRHALISSNRRPHLATASCTS